MVLGEVFLLDGVLQTQQMTWDHKQLPAIPFPLRNNNQPTVGWLAIEDLQTRGKKIYNVLIIIILIKAASSVDRALAATHNTTHKSEKSLHRNRSTTYGF